MLPIIKAITAISQLNAFDPIPESCFSNGLQIFRYLSIAIRLRVNIEARIVNVKAKLKTLQAASHITASYS
jgi:hypothetical protein